MHHSNSLTHDSEHITTITKKLWPPQVDQTSSRQIESDRTGCWCGIFWVCQEVSTAMHKMFAFFFNLSYMTTLVNDGPNYTLQTLMNLFVHENISRNCGHLKSTRHVAGKSKVVRPGCRCRICTCVEKSNSLSFCSAPV